MSETVLKIENVSKQYRLGEVGTGTLSHDLKRWWHLKRGKEDPYLKIGDENRRDVAGGDYVWALKDINFEVKKGEVLGIIGKNGAGKSTLLKLLSRVTAPTTGRIKARGRIASLLEVGTGMHPDLTGRENIFLNGAILGMTKSEIASKFDEIVAFSGCAKYVDTPVKRYSSGMKVRLGFAVAAFLEPEILIVDEVLAVGDAEFQKKAIGKMQDVAKGGGRTVLFVSHNMAAVKSLCTSGIILTNGRITYSSTAEDAVNHYLTPKENALSRDLTKRVDRFGSGLFRFTKIQFFNEQHTQVDQIISGEALYINIHYEASETLYNSRIVVGLNFRDPEESNIVAFLSDEIGFELVINETNKNSIIQLHIPKLLLRSGEYIIKLFSSNYQTTAANFLDVIDAATYFTVLPGDAWDSGKINRPGHYALMPSTFRLLNN